MSPRSPSTWAVAVALVREENAVEATFTSFAILVKAYTKAKAEEIGIAEARRVHADHEFASCASIIVPVPT